MSKAGASSLSSHVPALGSSSSSSAPFDILKALDCPVCMEMMEPPIFMCQHGHNICQKCRFQLAACPVCQSNFSSTRNFFAEQIVENLIRKCTFSKEGCTLSIAAKDWEGHLATCAYRQVECDLLQGKTCLGGVKMNYKNYFTHLKNVHGVQGIKGTVLNVTQFVTYEQSKLSSVMPRGVWPVQFMDACNEIFLTGTAAICGKIYWWIYVIGDDDVASNYISKLSLNLKSKNYETSWTGPVHSFRTPPELILQQGLCLLATTETLQPFKYVKIQHQMTQQEEDQPNVGWNLTYSVVKKLANPVKIQSSRTSVPISNEQITQGLSQLKLDQPKAVVVKQEPKQFSEVVPKQEFQLPTSLSNKWAFDTSITEDFSFDSQTMRTAIKQEPLTPSTSQAEKKKPKTKSKIKKGKSTSHLNLSG